MRLRNVEILCPECGSTEVWKVVYGHVAQPMDEKVIYGGCIVDSDPPEYGCLECGYFWRQFIKVGGAKKSRSPRIFSDPPFKF